MDRLRQVCNGDLIAASQRACAGNTKTQHHTVIHSITPLFMFTQHEVTSTTFSSTCQHLPIFEHYFTRKIGHVQGQGHTPVSNTKH